MAPELTAFLQQARPTEILLLLADTTPSLQQQLRLTFLELLRQQVLIVENRLIQRPPSGTSASAIYVRSGPAFYDYQPRAYEILLLRPFINQNLPELLLKHFVELTFQVAESAWRFSGTVHLQGPLFSLYSQTWWQRLLGIRQLAPSGNALRMRLTEWLTHQDMTLNRLAQRDKEAATTLASQLGGILFLLPTFRSPLGHILDRELFRAQAEQHGAAFVTDSSDSSPGSWYESGHHFDSHTDAGEHGSHSDGGGDSGCGGCGGD